MVTTTTPTWRGVSRWAPRHQSSGGSDVSWLRFWMYVAAWRIVLTRYGIWAMATGRRARHAAAGRASRSSWTGLPLHSGGRAGNHPATDLVAYLRRERQEAAFATYGALA